MRFVLEYILPFGSLGMLVLLDIAFKTRWFSDWFDDWIQRHVWNRESREVRGFEVKPITGETPVLREERDNDHG